MKSPLLCRQENVRKLVIESDKREKGDMILVGSEMS